jgi:hypothetical protein
MKDQRYHIAALHLRCASDQMMSAHDYQSFASTLNDDAKHTAKIWCDAHHASAIEALAEAQVLLSDLCPEVKP